VQTIKACIVSMEYKIKNNDGKKEVATLAESYSDAEKVKHLFENTLGWDKDDVKTFQDKAIHLKNLSDKIDDHIMELKITAKISAKYNQQQFNVFAFIGHGVINEKD
jgi:hypothetical protein